VSNNIYDDLTARLREHREMMQAIQSNANALADLLEDNLRAVSPWRLQRLKKKLASFNAHTGRWTR
jgi:hypothetical protein